MANCPSPEELLSLLNSLQAPGMVGFVGADRSFVGTISTDFLQFIQKVGCTEFQIWH